MRSFKRSNLTQKIITVIASLCFCAAILLFINVGTLTVRADETQNYTYKSIKIIKDDTLWSIAKKYCPESVAINDYLKIIRETNSLSTDHIIEGNYLLVPVLD